MEGKHLEVIKDLMEQLCGDMEYGSDDFESRLGRQKPDAGVTIIKMEGGKKDPMMAGKEDESMGATLADAAMGDKMSMGSDEEMADMDDDMMDEDESLKQRLMRLRG